MSDPTHRSNPKRAERLASTNRTFFQNGYQLRASQLSDAEIDLLLTLKPAKALINGLVTILEVEKGAHERHVHITYKSATADDRLRLATEARNFEELLTRCVAEAAARAGK